MAPSNLGSAYKGLNALFNETYAGVPRLYPDFAGEAKSESESEEYLWLSDLPAVREWTGDRHLHTLSGLTYTLTNKDYELSIKVKRNHVDDNKLAMYRTRIMEMAEKMARHRDKLVSDAVNNGHTETGPDGQYFFDTDHDSGGVSTANVDTSGAVAPWYVLNTNNAVKPFVLQVRQEPKVVALFNPDDPEVFMRQDYMFGVDDRKIAGYGRWQYGYKSTADLTSDNFGAVVVAMAAFKDTEGEPLNQQPSVLMVPPSLFAKGRALIDVDRLAGGATNPWYKYVKLVLNPFLTNA